ncbi:MAG TPA: tRNA (adenosine(37)-N6)-dimethylallyltransferase MiaA [Patescibacteria group bacterium]|nr:tRNA (adenosine(37)-N6)-dimethylallyltransferase MiaA [Patescibacteria group bacterium]
MPQELQKLIAIVGPTASGKTDLAFALAHKFNGYIICADSRTIYKEMNIGTAKPYGAQPPLLYKENPLRHCQLPPKADLPLAVADGGEVRYPHYLINATPHYGLDLIPPTEHFSATQFKKYAEHIIDNTPRLFGKPLSREDVVSSFLEEGVTHRVTEGVIPLLVGGTGLYISAIVDNLSFPDAPPNKKFRKEKEALDLHTLVKDLIKKDPDAQDVVDLKNKRRVIRALEVISSTDSPFSTQYKKEAPRYDVLILGVKRNREELYNRINKRVDEIMKQGFLEEFELLYKKYSCEVPGMTGIGYRQFCLWKQKKLSLEQAIEKFKQGDRNLAKRQLTWFKRDTRIHWIHSTEEAEHLIYQWLNA